MTTTGAGALRSIATPSEPSISTSSSWTILTTIWPGLIDFSTVGADRLGAHLVGEGAHDVERDVGLEQRAAHLAQRRRDIRLRQRAAAGQAVQNRAKAFL